MGESYWDDEPTSKEIEQNKIRALEIEYRYVTNNYELLNTRLADINVYDLLQILEDLKGAKERARWATKM